MALGLSLCAVTTLQLLYGTLHIMVPTVEQYTTPADEISHPNPRGTRAPAPLLPRGGEGESSARTPLFPKRVNFGSFVLSAGSLRCIGYYHEGGGGELCSIPSFPKGVSLVLWVNYWAAGLRCIGYLSCPSERACERACSPFLAQPPANDPHI